MAFRDAFTNTAAADAVGVFDAASGIQLFEGMRPINASVVPNIRYMKHPQENGASIADHRIVEPIAINMGCILNPETFRSTYQAIRTAATESTELVVQTKAGRFENMRIAAYPTEEAPRLFDTLGVNIVFEEMQTDNALVQTLAPSGSAAPANPSDTDTVDRGTQNGQDAGEVEEGSVLARILL